MIKTLTKLCLLIFIIGFSLPTKGQVAPTAGDVLISETSNFKDTHDYVELYNTTSNIITLANCKLIRMVSSGAYYSLDFNTDGSGDILIPANGFLLVSRSSSKVDFNTYWSIDVDALGVNYNTGTAFSVYANSAYKLRLGGTVDTDDGTIIDQTTSYVSKNYRHFQTPVACFNTVGPASTSDFTPGSFDIVDDISRWNLAFTGSVWKPSAPTGASGSLNVLINGVNAIIANNSVVNDLYLYSGAYVNNSTQTVTVNGDLTMDENTSFSISSNTGSLTVLGTSTISITGSGLSSNYNVWSSPFMNTSILNTFSGTNPCDIYVFQASKQQWKYDYAVPFATTCNGSAVTFTSSNVIPSPESTPDGNMDIGRGYFAPGSAISTRKLTSSGSINNGVILTPIYGSSVAVAGGNDWNLLGNPYISGLNVTKLINGNSSINAIYVYNGLTGAYNTYNTASSFFLPPGQGFFIDLNTGTDGQVGNFVMTNSLRTTSYDAFQKTNSGDGVDTTIAYISLNDNAGVSDQIQIYLDPDCLDGYDSKFDARKLWNDNNLNLTTLIETDPNFGPEPYVFNGLKSLQDQETKIIDLLIQTNSGGTFEISIDSLRDMPKGMSIVLEDNVTSKMTNLRTDNYTFNTSQSDSLENRFFIHLQYDASITGVEDYSNNKGMTIFSNTNYITIKSNLNSIDVTNVEVYNVLGKLVSTNKVTGHEVLISTTEFQTGVYIVRASNQLGQVFNTKVLIQ